MNLGEKQKYHDTGWTSENCALELRRVRENKPVNPLNIQIGYQLINGWEKAINPRDTEVTLKNESFENMATSVYRKMFLKEYKGKTNEEQKIYLTKRTGEIITIKGLLKRISEGDIKIPKEQLSEGIKIFDEFTIYALSKM